MANSAFSKGQQTTILTGDITGTGAGSITTAIGSGVIIDADINASAGIALSKLATSTSSQLAAILSDETGTGAAVFGTSPTLATPNIVGTATNNNASAGSVGELVESEIPFGSAFAISSAATTNVTSISLTAGDWDVWGNVWFSPAATTTATRYSAGINTVSISLPSSPGSGGHMTFRLAFPAGELQGIPAGQRRLSLSSTTTVYLLAATVYSVSTMTVYGYIGARRRR